MVSQLSTKSKVCLGCGKKLPHTNKSGYCASCFPKIRFSKKSRRICRDCGCHIGRKNIQRLCLSCRAKRRLNPKPRFEAVVKVVMIDGKKVLMGGKT